MTATAPATSQFPTLTLAQALERAPRAFASSKVLGGDYVMRRSMLRSIADAKPDELKAIGHNRLISLFSLLVREYRRYAGTHTHSDGKKVRLEFSDAGKHSSKRRAVWYYQDLKKAGDAVRAVLPPKSEPAREDPQLEMERLAQDGASAFAD